MTASDDTDSPTVLVTGASGGLGTHIVDMLDEAHEVRAFDTTSPHQHGRASLIGALDDTTWYTGGRSALRDALRGADAVVHAAGIPSLSATREELFEANRDLARRLFVTAADRDVDHFVHISCASVYRAEIGVRTEDSPTEAYNAFEESKLAAEEALRSLAETRPDAPDLTILRLGLLYGPGCTRMGAGMVTLPPILRGVSRYLPGLSGGPRTNWCHVRDAARAVETVLDDSRARDETYNVADETPLSFGEVLTSIAEGYDMDLGPSVRIPSVALWAVLSPLLDNDWAFEKARSLLRLLWRRVQRSHDFDSPLRPRLDRDALFYVRDDSILVADKLRSLGWSPQWPDYREGIVETIRWYQDQGWAPRYEREPGDATMEDHSTPLSFDERLRGAATDGDDQRRLELQLQPQWPSIPWPPSGGEGLLQGRISIDGIADQTPIRGTVRLRWMPVLQLDYEFGFRDTDDHACRFRGTRRIHPMSPFSSMTRLRGELVDRHGQSLGEVLAESTDGPLALLTSDLEQSPAP